MAKNLPVDEAPGTNKPSKRSIIGYLFKPQIGPTIKPLRESTKVFVHLIAGVFALYKLIPKDYPGLKDPETHLSFASIVRTAWANIKFTRDGAPQAILFFALMGILGFSAVIGFSAILSLFITAAHAQTVPITSSDFQPETQDIAQAWLDYLFNNTPLPNYYSNMGNAVPSTLTLQTALVSVLAFYSDAILIIAAIVLFYHLASMVVETAHHGEPMGKRASQIWAPIRLVFAVGLLVPVNNGLNCGQYIVIKVAEMGSGLASHAWDKFLDAVANYTPKGISPNAPIVTQIGADIISSEACMYDYNLRLATAAVSTPGLADDTMRAIPSASGFVLNGRTGTKISYSTPDLLGKDTCGWYFIPSAPAGASAAAVAAYAAESAALTANLSDFQKAGQKIKTIMPTPWGPGTGAYELDISGLNAIIKYQSAITNAMAVLGTSQQSPTAQVVQQIRPYGWIFAGTLMPTIARMQGLISNAVTDGVPQSQGPQIIPADATLHDHPLFSHIFWKESEGEYDIAKKASDDLNNFSIATSKSWSQLQANNTQCAAMLGLQDSSQGSAFGSWPMNKVMGVIDWAASKDGVWSNGSGNPCATGTPGAGLNTFRLGIDLTGPDILGQIVTLGHDNLDLAFDLISAAILGKTVGAVGGTIGGFLGGLITAGPAGAAGGAGLGAAAGSILQAFAGFVEFIATIFFACGFVLAFILPMFPFTRFFFAVLAWIGAILEAIIAIPLVALAHINPEGEGLPGASAKGAYFFIFNIFLRPILCVFGLVCGLLVFMIAANFLTAAYALAVAASGGTAYGHEAMAKIVYSVLYVVMLYICANHAFAMIDHLPENALRWMGASGQSMPALGNSEKLAQYESIVGAYVGSKGIGAITQSAGTAASGGAKAISDYKAEKKSIKREGDEADEKSQAAMDKKEDRQIAKERHEELISKL